MRCKLIAIMAFGCLTQSSAEAVPLRFEFDGTAIGSAASGSAIKRPISGDFVVETSTAGVNGSFWAAVRSNGILSGQQPLISPIGALDEGFVFQFDDSTRPPGSGDEVNIILGMGKWRDVRELLDVEVGGIVDPAHPRLPYPDFFGYGVGFAFVGPAHWLDADEGLHSLMRKISGLQPVEVWIEHSYSLPSGGWSNEDRRILGWSETANIELIRWQIVPEPGTHCQALILLASLFVLLSSRRGH
jgi:hypothetical protein